MRERIKQMTSGHIGKFAKRWIVLFFIVFAGCAGSDPARFYTLHSFFDTAGRRPAPDGQGLAIGIGPIEIPDYIDRPQIVTRTGHNEIMRADFDRWGGSLRPEILRVLTDNLSFLLPGRQVSAYPWNNIIQPGIQVPVTIDRFDGRLGEAVVLRARWMIIKPHGKEAPIKRESDIREPADKAGYSGLVTAHSRALERLSIEMAEALGSTGR